MLKSRLIRNEYIFLQSLFKILKNELQKPFFLSNVYMVDEKNFALLSDIIL